VRELSGKEAAVRFSWPMGPYLPPDNKGSFWLLLGVNNVTRGNEWVRLNSTVLVSVTGKPTDGCLLVEQIQGCGAAGKERDFPELVLDATRGDYTERATCQDADYFSLQPGEAEYWNLYFRCATPGAYHVALSVQCTYIGHSELVQMSAVDMVCPKCFDYWSGAPEAGVYRGRFTWNGTGYDKASPHN
jgi:hypothetical protein